MIVNVLIYPQLKVYSQDERHFRQHGAFVCLAQNNEISDKRSTHKYHCYYQKTKTFNILFTDGTLTAASANVADTI